MSDLTIPPEFELHELVGDWEAVFTNFIDKKRTIKRKEKKKKKKENNKLKKKQDYLKSRFGVWLQHNV